jgi:hypothetical protein
VAALAVVVYGRGALWCRLSRSCQAVAATTSIAAAAAAAAGAAAEVAELLVTSNNQLGKACSSDCSCSSDNAHCARSRHSGLYDLLTSMHALLITDSPLDALVLMLFPKLMM